ncbi:MAG: DUF4159 domain-containing protein [Rhodobacteraceae bacterium]|nr:DUF4159 domain-containing protein [Paracoccaceae bacterium]
MWMLGPIGFTAPLLLIGLIALPILWFILRAVPPAPIRRRFPGVVLLLGLTDEKTETDRTPWWLLLLRMTAIATFIIAFAGPVLNPEERKAGTNPLLILFDASWADADDWARRIDRATTLLNEATREGRTVAIIRLTDTPTEIAFQSANAWAGRLAALTPNPWLPTTATTWATKLPKSDFDSFWLSDGLDHPNRSALFDELSKHGTVTVFTSPRPILALHPATFDDGTIQLSASRLPADDPLEVEVIARGPDPSGIDRELARATLSFNLGTARTEVTLSLPPELRNRINRFELAGIRSAGAISLTDDSLKRRKIALIGGRDGREGLLLLSPTHYLRQALEPVADLIEGSLTDTLLANPNVVILADVAKLTQTEQDAILDWLDKGGMLLRFAGPSLATSDISRSTEDPLLPVRLREGGHTVSGAMSWGEPKTLAPFPETSPFHGFPVPEDVTVSTQVLSQPDPDLASRTIAALTDGTPLVTRKTVGQGQVVLFHVTANAEWSTLPLSGLFVQMLERLAISTRPATPDTADLAKQTWIAETLIDAYDQKTDTTTSASIAGETLATALNAGPGPDVRPGLYAGLDHRVALNAVNAKTILTPATWPTGTTIEGLDTAQEKALKGSFLTAGLLMLLLDIIAALAFSGRLPRLARSATILLIFLMLPPQARAQDEADDTAIRASKAVTLAYVITSDTQLDDIAKAGLTGLSERLRERTSVEPKPPVGVNIETDELAFFPFLYWPISTSQPLPSVEAYTRLNDYLRTGGMILFDTRDADLTRTGGTSSEGEHLQKIAAGLDIPALEPLPQDHVLTRSFYLLQDFPGRYSGATLWVEAASPYSKQVEGMPFRNLNDGVTPVVIGSNDWAAAWAINTKGEPMFPVGRGLTGERQREMANRFGINLIMHVLTGNYKSDQVHVPALLERLGQ